VPAVSSYPSTVPSLTSAERARLLARDIRFDSDYTVAPKGDWATVEGPEAMRQAVYQRLITSPGEYRARREYGVGIMDFLKEAMATAMVAELKTRVRANLLQDRRIQDVLVTVEEKENALRLNIAVTIKGQRMTFRPFDFARAA
jgi:phage baseplate assembly protein W